jgi:hypothetical protein
LQGGSSNHEIKAAYRERLRIALRDLLAFLFFFIIGLDMLSPVFATVGAVPDFGAVCVACALARLIVAARPTAAAVRIGRIRIGKFPLC